MNPWLIIGAGLIFMASLGGAYSKGYSAAKSKFQVKVLKETIKEVEQHEKKKDEVTRLPASELKRRYCKWVHDDEQECLSADIPVR